MRKKKHFFIIITLLIAAFVFLRLVTGTIYLSHPTAAKAAVEDLLEDSEQHELAILINTSQTINQADTPAWLIKKVELENTAPFWRSLFDDDPIYRLKAHLEITGADGNQTTIIWESWRYGLVIGPVVVSMGDGPPGYVIGALN